MMAEKFILALSKTFHNHPIKLSAPAVLNAYNKADTDGNGFLEGDELDRFLREFVSSVTDHDVGTEVVSEAMLSELKKDFMDAYDENGDGKIEIRELAQLLPTDENFLLLFQLDSRMNSSVEFMKTWNKYDQDKSGFIDSVELKGFLNDLINKPGVKKVEDETLEEYTASIIEIFDENKDGKLQLSEMARLLPVKENVLSAAISKTFLKGSKPISIQDIDKIFSAYDKDCNKALEGDEIDGFIKDLIELMKPNYNSDDLIRFRDLMIKSCDVDGDGKICKEELTMMLLGLQKYKA